MSPKLTPERPRPVARGRAPFRRRGGPGPNYNWARFVDDVSTVAGTTKVFLAQLVVGQELDFTIIRNRGRFIANTDQQAAGELWSGAFGIIVVSAQAASVGATAIPGPVTDQDADWMVWEPFQGLFSFGTNVGFDGNSGIQFEFDSKAMRKISEDQVAAVMVENNTANAFQFTLGLSTLGRLRGN